MLTKTFEARVEKGLLQHRESLRAFEGQQVYVTLIAPAAPQTQPEGKARLPAEEPPAELDVEKDVYVQVPLPGEVLKDAVVVEGSPLRPCLIFPEELPDE